MKPRLEKPNYAATLVTNGNGNHSIQHMQRPLEPFPHMMHMLRPFLCSGQLLNRKVSKNVALGNCDSVRGCGMFAAIGCGLLFVAAQSSLSPYTINNVIIQMKPEC